MLLVSSPFQHNGSTGTGVTFSRGGGGGRGGQIALLKD